MDEVHKLEALCARLDRIEANIATLMRHLGCPKAVEPEWQKLALDPKKKIAAVHKCKVEMNLTISEAKIVVEEFASSRGISFHS
jgi:hypothetical protein